MNIHEYQASNLFREYGIPVPEGYLAETPEEAREASKMLGGRCVIKAQIHSGGRGKAGGVKLASDPDEAARLAEGLLGSILVTKQTGNKGKTVRKLFVTECADIEREFYFSITMDNREECPVLIFSSDGGTEIEELAKTAPEKIGRMHIDPVFGLMDYQLRYMLDRMDLEKDIRDRITDIAFRAYRLFREKDCSLVEINPLIADRNGNVTAVDAKINFDDNALFRHPDIRLLRDELEEEEREREAGRYDLNYIQLDGDIACMVNGAGLAMATMDIIKAFGGSPANFLDVGGSATKEKIEGAFRILLSDPNVKGIFVNIFGGIMKCDIIAGGIVDAAKSTSIEVPLVVRLTGTHEEEGKKILAGSGLAIISAEDLADGAQKICRLVEEARK